MSDFKPREGSKVRWKTESDGRMRYEQSHPMPFSQPIGVNLDGGCDCPRNQFGFKKGCPHLGKQRATYPHAKAKGRF
jgi:hypothetical protein